MGLPDVLAPFRRWVMRSRLEASGRSRWAPTGYYPPTSPGYRPAEEPPSSRVEHAEHLLRELRRDRMESPLDDTLRIMEDLHRAILERDFGPGNPTTEEQPEGGATYQPENRLSFGAPAHRDLTAAPGTAPIPYTAVGSGSSHYPPIWLEMDRLRTRVLELEQQLSQAEPVQASGSESERAPIRALDLRAQDET